MTETKPPSKIKTVLKRVLIGFVTVLAVFAAVVAFQPPEYSVTRTATIAAPASTVFALVNDLHKWEAWSPWAKIDPAMKQTYEGAAAGTGASSSWAGNKEVGEGRMTVTESRADELIKIKLEFFKPMEGVSVSEFAFKADGAKTTVTWSMTGHKNFISKAICMFMDMDKMLGGQFEKGLAQLKSVAEAEPKK
jgi:uncharacterized protein YndB with AHSA1/START domain